MAKQKGFGINFGGGLGGGNKKNEKNMPPKKKVEYTGDPSYENDRNEELLQMQEEFRESARKEVERRDDYMDDQYYSCIVFSNKAQRQRFFQLLGMAVGDETDLKFINGPKLAELLGFELPPNSVLPPERFKVSKAVMQLTHLPKPAVKRK